jgi:1-aminocyclopropane-1-carboxylate deaminase
VSHAAPVRPLDLRLPSPLDELPDGRLTRAGVRLYLKRDDLISPEIPGNKWRKLKYNLAAARAQGHQVLLTFGGAYSNHIRATRHLTTPSATACALSIWTGPLTGTR